MNFLSFIIFYQYTALISRAVDGHQMYSGGSVAGKASTIGIFTDGQKVRKLASFSTSLKFEPPPFENAARYPNSETNFLCNDDRAMSSPSFVKLGPRTQEPHSPRLKLLGENVLNRR